MHLRALYDELDGEIDRLLARHPTSQCRECGTCCTFPPGAPVLYATALEHAYLASEPPPMQAGLGEGTCPYVEIETSYCMARGRRTLGCRTHFCDDAMPEKAAREEAQDLYERALGRLREVSEAHGIRWGYAPVIDRL
ncbi:MAG: hypothetical protein ACYTKD_03875 [Planctomycetota bacterium]